MHNVYDVGDELVFTVDAKTLMSKKEGWLGISINSWKSLDKLKARYIAEIQSSHDIDIGRPYKVTLDGKTVCKVPFYDCNKWDGLYGYVYVDLTTGKSKFTDSTGKTEGWRTLKEVDDSTNEMYNLEGKKSFRDDLRDLFSE